MEFIYPAILDYTEDDFINVTLPCFEFTMTCVDRDGDYISAVQELLSLAIVDYEEKGLELPKASDFQGLEDQKIVFVKVDMEYWRPLIINTRVCE